MNPTTATEHSQRCRRSFYLPAARSSEPDAGRSEGQD
jgi:hypothetical protein